MTTLNDLFACAKWHSYGRQKLSARELQVLCLWMAGFSMKETAQMLKVYPSTVKTYRTKVLNKLGLESKQAVYRKLFQHGVLHEVVYQGIALYIAQ